jgi:hypothetical protein
MTLLLALTVLAVVGLCYGFLVVFRSRRPRTPEFSVSAERPPPRDDVRFTVYRPAAVEPERWCELLVYAHRAEGPIEDGGWQPDLSDTVRGEALQALGDVASAYRTATEDAAQPVVRHTQLEFVPEVDGFRFNPPRIVLDWAEELHRAHFRMKADAALAETTARGQLTIFNGPLIIAQLALVIRVSAKVPAEEPVRSAVAPYRRVFASYARTDTAVVRRLRDYARALGDDYLIDVADIRAGEQWEPRIEQLIAQADVFQLFWSWNAIASEYVQREWRYALSLGRPNFIRPVYWEEPLPEAPDRGLPPPELRAVHFQRVPVVGVERTIPPPAVQIPAPRSPAEAPSAPAPPRRKPTRLPSLATAALLVIAIGGIGLYQISLQTDSQPAATTAPPVRPTDVPPAPAAAEIMVGGFEAPAGDTALLLLADELRRGVVSAWGGSIALAPAGTGPLEAARAEGSVTVITATVAATPDEIRIDARITDVGSGTSRTARPVTAPRGTPVSALVQLVVESLREDLSG